MKAQIEAGIRVNTLILDKEKSGGKSGTTVTEPRINASLSLLNKQNCRWIDDLSVTGGYGLSHKMPSLLYLYPDRAYFDHVALGRWSEQPGGSMALMQTTIIEQTQNPNLKPTRSRKWEIGLSLRKKQVNVTITYFNERHSDEFAFMSQPTWIDYPYFTVPEGAEQLSFNATDGSVGYMLNGQPGTATKTMYTERVSWGMADNCYLTRKHGIEYTLNVGEWKPIRTSLNITGAWFWIKRQSQKQWYENVNVDTRLTMPNQYMIVQPEGAGGIQDRINTNFAFITHIPQLKMIFTTTLQVVWRQSSQPIYEDAEGNNRYYMKEYSDRSYWVVDPVGYYDMQQNWHEWSSADASNTTLNPYMRRLMDYAIESEVIDPWAMLSMRFTKELGKTGEVSFIANNLTNTHVYRRYKNSNSQFLVHPPMYFGAEVKLKF